MLLCVSNTVRLDVLLDEPAKVIRATTPRPKQGSSAANSGVSAVSADSSETHLGSAGS